MTAQAGPGRADIPRKCRRCPAGGSGRAAAIALRAPCSGIEIQESNKQPSPTSRPGERNPSTETSMGACPSSHPSSSLSFASHSSLSFLKRDCDHLPNLRFPKEGQNRFVGLSSPKSKAIRGALGCFAPLCWSTSLHSS